MNESNEQRNDEHGNQGANVGAWIGAAVAGALLMYAFDPERGAARRARARGALRDAGHRTGDTLGNAWHHAEDRFDSARVRASKAAARASARLADAAHAAGDRLAEASHHTRDRFEHARDRLSHAAHDARERVSEAADDARERADKFADRTRDRAEHVAERARERTSQLAHEARQRSDHAAERARERANEVADRARDRSEYVRERADHAASRARDSFDDAAVAARDGARAAGSKFSEWTDQLAHAFGSRSPALTNSALLGTGALSVVGLVRRSPAAALLGLGALAVLLRSDRGRNMLASLRGRSASQVEVENAVHIDASPKEVFDAWSDVENFPRFMSHVTEVRDLGHRRSHWVVSGPGGMEYAWNAVMTEQTRPDRLSWRSEPGSEIEQEGTVTFEPSRGGTLVTVRMRYSPPAGVLGHGIAKMLGADPQRQMDDDLARMKAFIERGPNHPAAQPRESGASYLH